MNLREDRRFALLLVTDNLDVARVAIPGTPQPSARTRFVILYHGESAEGHGGPQESVVVLLAERLTEQIIGLAIEVHRHTGPGLLESVYEQCLCHELREAGLAFARQVPIPVVYKQKPIGDGFKADIIVARSVILEIKAVAAIIPAHEAQLHTYLRMSRIRVGLILNFNASRLTDGIRRYVV